MEEVRCSSKVSFKPLNPVSMSYVFNVLSYPPGSYFWFRLYLLFTKFFLHNLILPFSDKLEHSVSFTFINILITVQSSLCVRVSCFRFPVLTIDSSLLQIVEVITDAQSSYSSICTRRFFFQSYTTLKIKRGNQLRRVPRLNVWCNITSHPVCLD